MGCGASTGGAQGKYGSQEQHVRFLKKVPLLKKLQSDDLHVLASHGLDADFAAGEAIITQGDEGLCMFVIQSGSAKVEIDGRERAMLKSGDYFGELSLLRNTPRTATITALTKVQALKITSTAFHKLDLAHKLHFPKREAVGGGVVGEAEIKPPSPKTPEDIKLISEALKANANLNTIAHLDDDHINALIEVMWKQEVRANTELVKQGDLHADYFYVVSEGIFEVSKIDANGADRKSASQLGSLKAGSSFGELALLYFAPRAATVVAKCDAVVWVTARVQFKDMLLRASAKETKEHLRHLNRCDIFAPLKDSEKKELAASLHDMVFYKGDHIFEQGELGTQFFLLVEGEVAVIKDGKEVERLAATQDKAQYFGEQALLNDEPRTASIHVVSDKAKAMWVDRESFEMLLGSLHDLKTRGKDGEADVKKRSSAVVAERQFGLIKMADLS
eukprot:TRINITY_DN7107_c0_g1_i2.p1 TRINITY_DN7107_c0_g1~~TRINITY_DN7107_c0_g1_i2.p1  ORF type:complete len:459 (-),score=120.69 TRINITY_DN7107_c0_g1_i2:93-1433(-)